MLEAIRLRASWRYIWSRRMYILQLRWIHPEWLRAIVALLVALPLYAGFVLGATAFVILVPLVLLTIFVGFSWAVVILLAFYVVLFFQLRKWIRRYNQVRPRRRARRQ